MEPHPQGEDRGLTAVGRLQESLQRQLVKGSSSSAQGGDGRMAGMDSQSDSGHGVNASWGSSGCVGGGEEENRRCRLKQPSRWDVAEEQRGEGPRIAGTRRRACPLSMGWGCMGPSSLAGGPEPPMARVRGP